MLDRRSQFLVAACVRTSSNRAFCTWPRQARRPPAARACAAEALLAGRLACMKEMSCSVGLGKVAGIVKLFVPKLRRASPSQFSSECSRASPSYAQQLRRVSVESATEPAEAPDETDIQQLPGT